LPQKNNPKQIAPKMQNQAPSSSKKRIFQAAWNQSGTVYVILEGDSGFLGRRWLKLKRKL
jgi:hypothetical protein